MKLVQSKSAFTLVEIMIVVAIIGLLAAIAIPTMLEAGWKTRRARFAREIQSAGHTFVQYAFDHAAYPPDRLPGQMAAGMSEYLGRFPWSEKTTIGGNWDWDYQQFGITAGVSVHAPTCGNDQMQKIDALMDDGNLATGQFRQRAGGYIYIIED